MLTVNAFIGAAFIAANGLFTPSTPHWLIMMVLLVGGCFRSLQFTSLNAIAYADVSNRDMSYATSLSSVAQQLALSIGVALGAGGARDREQRSRRAPSSTAGDFCARLLVVGGDLEPCPASSSPGSTPSAGAEMSGHQSCTQKPAAGIQG